MSVLGVQYISMTLTMLSLVFDVIEMLLNMFYVLRVYEFLSYRYHHHHQHHDHHHHQQHYNNSYVIVIVIINMNVEAPITRKRLTPPLYVVFSE